MSWLSRLVRKERVAALILLLSCAAMFLPGLGTAIVNRQQELRVLLASRTMAEGGSWLVPQFMGEERLRKPPLMYWLVASAFRAAGSTDNVAAARAVSAAGATALVLATFFCGRRFVGRQVAFLGALALVTSIGFIRHARLAETDIPQAVFCSLAIFSLYAALNQRHKVFRYWALVGVFSGIGFMIKGPACIAMPAAAAITFLIAEAVLARRKGMGSGNTPEPRTALKKWLGVLLAVAIFAAIAAPWYVAIAMQTSAATRAQAGDEISRLLVESRHHGPFIYYVYTLPARLGAWALLLPVAVYGASRAWWRHRRTRFILCWFASSFLILSALQSKQQHYALLLFAPSALFCGWLLKQAFRHSRTFYPRFARGNVAGLCILLPAIAAVGVASCLFPMPAEWVPLRNASLPMLGCCGVVGLIGFLRRRNPLAGILAIVVAHMLVMSFQTLRLEQLQSGYSVVPALLDANRSALQSAPRVMAAGKQTSLMAWYAHRDIHVITNDFSAAWHQASPGDVLIASERDGRTDIVSQIPDVPLAATSHLSVTITLFRKTGAAP